MQQRPLPSMLNNFSLSTQPPPVYSAPVVIPDQLPSRPRPPSSVPRPSLHQAIALVTAQSNERAIVSNPTSAASQMPSGYPHPLSASAAPPRPQAQHRNSYPLPMDPRRPPIPSAHPIQVSGSGTGAPRVPAPTGDGSTPTSTSQSTYTDSERSRSQSPRCP
jgi:hypothetical protein